MSPYLVRRFKSFADAELRYDFKQVLADEQQGQQFSDDTTHRGRFSLESGTDFSRLQWTFLTQASYTDRSQAHDIERADADLELEYFASPVVSFIAAGGYQMFDDGNAGNEVDGPSWRVGIRL